MEPRLPVRDPPARGSGTADSSSPARPGSVGSTPATSSSPTLSWPRATPTPPPTRATADRGPSPTESTPVTPSPSGTPASRSSPSPPRTSLEQRYHREPRRTYVAGFSAAGYLARWQLENRPDLYDGGIAWSGVLMTPDRNLLSYLPTALRTLPAVRGHRSPEAHQALLDAGFPAGSEPTWAYSYRAFWDPFQRILREEIDPTYDGDRLAGYPALRLRDRRLRRRLRPGDATGRGQGSLGEDLPDRTHRQAAPAAPGNPRHRRHPARLPALRRDDRDQGRGRHHPALRGRGRHPLRGDLYTSVPRLCGRCCPASRTRSVPWRSGRSEESRPASHLVPRDPTDLVNTCTL